MLWCWLASKWPRARDAGRRRDRPPGVTGPRAGPLRQWAAVGAILALAAVVYGRGLGNWFIDDDEESYLYAAWRVCEGELPYRDFLTPQLPAFLAPGAAVVCLAGRDAVALRRLSVALILGAAAGLFLVGRRLFGFGGALAAMSVFLALEDVFTVGRAFRPEATMLAAVALGLYAAVRAGAGGGPWGYAAASLAFGFGVLAKLFAALPWAGVVLFVVWEALAGRPSPPPTPRAARHSPRRRALADGVALVLPGVVLVVTVVAAFAMAGADMWTAVVGHQLRQGAGRSAGAVLGQALAFYADAVARHPRLVAFAPLGVAAAPKFAGRLGRLVGWQLVPLVAFLVLRRDLFPRHFTVFLPALSLAFGAAVAAVLASVSPPGAPSSAMATGAGANRRAATGRRPGAGLMLAATVTALVALPQFFDVLDNGRRRETGTRRAAVLLKGLVPAGAKILSDYPGLGFFAGRATTATAAGLSEGAAESGQITGRDLLDEMAGTDVPVVLMDRTSEGGQLEDMVDFDTFLAAVEGDYESVGHFWRYYQRLEVFMRRDVPRLGLDFGWAQVLAAGADPTALVAGRRTEVGLVLRARRPAPTPYTALVHLVGPDGIVWANGDGLLTNSLQRSTEEWEADEIVAVPLELRVPLGTPPGPYRLRFGLYDRASGQRLAWHRGAEAGEVYDGAEVVVRRPPAGARWPAATIGEAGPFTLLAAEVPLRVRAGDALSLDMTWGARNAPGEGWRLRVRLVDATGAEIASGDIAPAWPTASWRRGEVSRVRGDVAVGHDAAGGLARLMVNWVKADRSEAELDAGAVEVVPLPPAVDRLPPGAAPIAAAVGPRVLLSGADVPARAIAGQALGFTVFWQPLSSLERRYQVLVHVVDATGAVVAQGDGPPGGGERPTTSWRPGEIVADKREVWLPRALAGETVQLLVGLYDPEDDQLRRLPVTVDGDRRADGRVPLGPVMVVAAKP